MAIKLPYVPKFQAFDANGAPLVGGKVYFYQAGTSTPKATYTDSTGNTENANPVILNARGEASIWIDGTYKLVLKDSNDVTIYTVDNYGAGEENIVTGNFNIVTDGSFEVDEDGDGQPDNWDIIEYTDGTVVLDSTEQVHGLYALKFVSLGTGGGYATSRYFEVPAGGLVDTQFSIKSSAADVRNKVDIVWYTAAKAVISTTSIYDDSTTNPTSWTRKRYWGTSVPATAKYAKIRVYGCESSDTTPGAVWYDDVKVTTNEQLFQNVNAQITATDEELNLLDGVTATTAELNLVDGSVAGTAVASKALVLGADKNVDTLAIADGGLKLGAGAGTAVTATAAELNTLDGITATVTELNYTDGVTSPLQTQIDSKINSSRFPNVNANVTASDEELNHSVGVTSAIQTQLNAKAPTASPTFTGTPAAPTAAASTDSTQIATTAFVKDVVFQLASATEPAVSPTFEFGVPIGAAWESVGPTGSGATNIWTALDSVPSGAKWISVLAIVEATHLSGGTQKHGLHARANGSSATNDATTEIARILVSSVTPRNGYATSARIPVSSSRLFDLYNDTAGGTVSVIGYVVLQGWGF